MRVAILILELVRNAASFFFLSHFVKCAHIFWFLFHRAESTGWSRISWICASVFPKRKVCWLFRLEKKLADISLAYVVSSSREPLFLLVFHGRVLRLLTRSKSMTKFARRRYQLLLRSNFSLLCVTIDTLSAGYSYHNPFAGSMQRSPCGVCFIFSLLPHTDIWSAPWLRVLEAAFSWFILPGRYL